jgi:hypothetical protein
MSNALHGAYIYISSFVGNSFKSIGYTKLSEWFMPVANDCCHFIGYRGLSTTD